MDCVQSERQHLLLIVGRIGHIQATIAAGALTATVAISYAGTLASITASIFACVIAIVYTPHVTIIAAGLILAFVGGGAAYQRHVGQGDGAEDGEDTLGCGFEEAAARLEFILFLFVFHNFNIPYRLAGFGLG